MKIKNWFLLAIWVTISWGMLGAMLKIVTTETPDWVIMLLTATGGVAMYAYFAQNENLGG